MAASKTLSLSTAGTGMPDGASTSGPIVDTVSPAIKTAGSLVLSNSFQQITVPAAATSLELFMTGNVVNITIAGANTDTGINLGSGWSWQRIGVLGGTTTFWVKAASGTPTLNYEFN
jgi:hypothetical protein